MREEKRTERKERSVKNQEHKTGTEEKRYYRLYDVTELRRY